MFDFNKKGVTMIMLDSRHVALNPVYGLSKVHQTVIDNKPKQRPILSAFNTPTYKLSKFLVKILEPHTKNKLTAK